MLLGNRQVRVSEGICCPEYFVLAICHKSLPPPFEGVNFALSTHPISFYLTPHPPLTAANVIWVFREFSVKDEVTNKNPFVILILYYKRDSSVLIEFWCSATLFLTAILCYVMFC